MRSQYAALSILALLVSTYALSHDEEATTAAHAKITRTVVVTVTHTIDQSSTASAPLPTDPTLVCPMANQSCIIDGIPIWPNSTSLPRFTLDPSGNSTLKTIMSSSATSFGHSTSLSTGRNATNTITSVASPSISSSASHSMSHMVPDEGNSMSWTTTITEPIEHSSTSTSTSETHTSQQDKNLPPDTPLYTADQAPTPTLGPSSAKAKATTDVLDPAAWASMDGALMTRSKRGEENSAQRRHKTFWSRLFVAAYPQTPVQIVRDEDEAEDQDDFTHGNELENVKMECVQCPKGRSIVCIDGGFYGYCDEGCAEPRKLKEGMKCVDGRIYGVRIYHDGT